MKKYLLVLFVFFIANTAYGAVSYSRTPTGNITSETYNIDVSFDDIQEICFDHPIHGSATTWGVSLYNINDGLDSATTWGIGASPLISSWIDVIDKNETFIFSQQTQKEIDTVGINCNFNGNLRYGLYYLEGDGTYTLFSFGIAESGNPFSMMIEEANNGYKTVTGETMGATVAWTGDAFIKPFLGGALLPFWAMRYWIMALIIISLIAYFAHRMIGFAPRASYNERKITKDNPTGWNKEELDMIKRSGMTVKEVNKKVSKLRNKERQNSFLKLTHGKARTAKGARALWDKQGGHF